MYGAPVDLSFKQLSSLAGRASNLLFLTTVQNSGSQTMERLPWMILCLSLVVFGDCDLFLYFKRTE